MKHKLLITAGLVSYLLISGSVKEAHAIASSLSMAYLDWTSLSVTGDFELGDSFSSSLVTLQNTLGADSDSEFNNVGNPTSVHVNSLSSYASASNDLTDKAQIDIKAQSDGINDFTAAVFGEARNVFHFTALSDGYMTASAEYFLFHALESEHQAEFALADTTAVLSLVSEDQTAVNDAKNLVSHVFNEDQQLSENRSGTFYVEKWFNRGESGYFSGWVFARAGELTVAGPLPGDGNQPVIPEPSTMLLFGSGLFGALIRRKKSK